MSNDFKVQPLMNSWVVTGIFDGKEETFREGRLIGTIKSLQELEEPTTAHEEALRVLRSQSGAEQIAHRY